MFKHLLFLYGESKSFSDENGTAFIDGLYNKEFWDRYFLIAEELTVVLRKAAKEELWPSANLMPVTDKRMQVKQLQAVTSSLSALLSVKIRKQNRKLLEEEIKTCDAVIIRLPSFLGNEAIGICRKKGKPYMVETVGDPYTSLKYHSRSGRFLAPMERKRLQKQVKNAPYVLYVSQKYLQDLYPTNGICIGCSDANIPAPSNDAFEMRLQRIEKFDSTRPLILGLIGTLGVNYRGHDTLLRTVKKLKDEGVNVSVKFLGGGSKARWEEYANKLGIRERIEFSGVLPAGECVYHWLDDIDILVMPTKAESLGRAVLEGMSRGCPVIGTKTTALRELIREEELVMPDDENAIAEIIKGFLKNPDKMKESAIRNFEKAKEFSNEKTKSIREEFFKRFAEGK